MSHAWIVISQAQFGAQCFRILTINRCTLLYQANCKILGPKSVLNHFQNKRGKNFR